MRVFFCVLFVLGFVSGLIILMEISNKFFCLLGFDVVVVGYGYLGDGNVYLNVLVCEYKDEVWVFILVDFCCVWFILFVERSCLMYIL